MNHELRSKIYVAGHRGMVGAAIVHTFEKQGNRDLIYRTSKELDLKDQIQALSFFIRET